MKDFKPMLAPNDEVKLNEIKYPLLASYKLDGIRCIFLKGQILSRSLKPIVNKQLRERFEPLRKFSEEHQVILDGEIYSPKLTFQEITHFVMTQDLGDEVLPDHLKFYCFDSVREESPTISFKDRFINVVLVIDLFTKISEIVKHKKVHNLNDVENLFQIALKDGFEGLILRDPDGRYKYGRGTIKEGLIFKVKPYLTFDAQITGVVQSTEVSEGAEKKINELGRSVTSKKKDDRVLIEKASGFWVKYEDKDLKVTLSMTDAEKEAIWLLRESYIGQWIEYKGMLVGAKDVPRHPVMIRFREDKNDSV